MKPILYLIIPCYNEEEVLPISSKMFLDKMNLLKQSEVLHENSRILFVNDGSSDTTWEIICKLASENKSVVGISQGSNWGHQNAVLAGLMEAKDVCDIAISMDCDGQDDIDAIDEMISAYLKGFEIVYGVRNDRSNDSFWKRNTAQLFYKFMSCMGTKTVYNHADFRLLSRRALQELAKYKEANLYLRGLIPLLGLKSTIVYYKRNERIAGTTHYPFKKMLHLALSGITCLSIEPIHLITRLGFWIAVLSFVGVVWSVTATFLGYTVEGWASLTSIICFIGGIQLICMGVLGEYIGKIYLEVKQRPRYNICERTMEITDETNSQSNENANQ